mmetsp:Transcript_280/g.26  ORF Transcript_280/g.26 Transcript_280/m.26 type:complete len:99 (-) Transcript_280:15-311(-)
MNGSWNNTYVDFNEGECFCNNNGNFESELSKDVFEQVKRDFPTGSWINSARNYKFSNGVLVSELRRRNGSWRTDEVRIDMGRPYNLSNNDGYFELSYN